MSAMPNKCPSAASKNVVLEMEKFQLAIAEKLLHTIIMY